VIEIHPEWSDRRIAQESGTTHPTVGKVRAEIEASSAATGKTFQVIQPRIGRDQKPHLTRGAATAKAQAVLEKDPTASVREVAKQAGVSTRTVQQTKRRLVRSGDADGDDAPRKTMEDQKNLAPSTPAPQLTDEAVEVPEENLIEEEVSVVRPQRRSPTNPSNLQKEDILKKFKNHVDHHLNPMFEYLGDYVVPPNRHPWIQDLRDELGSLLGEGA
jgi:hypothetical protein